MSSSSSLSYCELCGRQTVEKKMVIVDGSVFRVCQACSKHGKPYVPAQLPATKKDKKPAAAAAMPRAKKIMMSDETILTPNFATLIREARMKMGLTHEQLGMKLNERATLLKKFEAGTLKPDEQLAKKLERFLGIKLYISVEEEKEDDDNNNNSSK